MKTAFPSQLTATTRRLSTVSALIVLIIAGLVLVGWMLDISHLKSLRPDWVTMKVNTALCFAFAGFSLLCYSRNPGPVMTGLARSAAVLVTAIGSVSLLEIVFGWDLKIDQLFFQDPSDAIYSLRPGLMALNSAVCFIFTGISLILAERESRPENQEQTTPLIGQILMILVGTMAFLSCAGYLYGVVTFVGVPRYLRMAIHTAGAFLLLSIGILCLKPRDGFMALVVADAPGSRMLRYLALPTIFSSFVFFWLRLLGEQFQLYDSTFGTSLMMVGSSIFLLALLVTTAYWLNRSDTGRQSALEELARERALLKTLIRTIPDLVWLKDPKGVYLTCNPRFERFFGSKEEEILGKTDYDFMPADLADFFRTKDREAVAAGRSQINEEWVTYVDDGHRELLETIKTPMYDAQGTLIGVLGVARDITGFRQAQQELVLHRNRLRNMLDLMEDGVYIVDRDCRIEYVNPAFEKLFGNIAGRPCYKYFHNLDSACPWCVRNEVLAGKTVKWEHYFTVIERNCEIFDTPFLNEDESYSMLGVVHDITAHKEAQRKLQEAQAQAIQQEKLAILGQLSAGVAHEINNPVGFVRSNLGSLAKYIQKVKEYIEHHQELTNRYVPPDIQTDLEYSRKKTKLDFVLQDAPELIHESIEGTERIKRIVQDLLSFSRRNTEELSPVDLKGCLQSTVSLAWNEIKHVAELKVELGEIPLVMGNVQRLSQVFLNLLVNAAHAMDKQGVISLVGYEENGFAVVEIHDTGHGIPEHVLPHIFEPFFTTKEEGKGTGLGLSIAHDIIVKHGGTIAVESTPGAGTVFKVCLPGLDEEPSRS